MRSFTSGGSRASPRREGTGQGRGRKPRQPDINVVVRVSDEPVDIKGWVKRYVTALLTLGGIVDIPSGFNRGASARERSIGDHSAPEADVP